MMIDLLDTFGDFVELAIAMVGLYFAGIFAHTFLFSKSIPQIIGTISFAMILWFMVYDYDLVLGFLIGGLLFGIMALISGKHYRDKQDDISLYNYRHMMTSTGRGITYLVVAGVMILKIVLFW